MLTFWVIVQAWKVVPRLLDTSCLRAQAGWERAAVQGGRSRFVRKRRTEDALTSTEDGVARRKMERKACMICWDQDHRWHEGNGSRLERQDGSVTRKGGRRVSPEGDHRVSQSSIFWILVLILILDRSCSPVHHWRLAECEAKKMSCSLPALTY